jgi:hypothetical protein
MFFFPIDNLPPAVREKYIKNLIEINKKNKENTKKQKEINMYKKIINNPPKSLSLKSMMIYSHAFRKLKELEK